MKNKILLFGGLLTIVATLTGCDDILNKDPLDRFTDTPQYWSNPSNVEGQCNTFYEDFTGYGNGGGSGLYYFKTLSDDQAGSGFADWSYLNVPSTDGNWTNGWSEIRRANYIINRAGSNLKDAAVRNHYVGIGRLMRAYQYYQLVRMYGDLQWVNTVLDTKDEDILYGKRISRDVVMDSVLQDLNFACANINESTSKIVFTRQMANAMKADICLWEGTFRKYRSATDGQAAPDLEGSKKFLNACVDACTYIMGKGYSLNSSYQGNYNSADLTSNPEMIFFKAYKKDIFMHSLIDYTCSSTQLSGITKDAFDSFLFTDGKPLSTTSLNKSDAGTVDANGNVDITSLLAVRDQRLSAITDHIVFYKGNTWSRTSDGMQMTSSTGYGVSKYDNTTIPVGYRNQTGRNYTCAPIFWLSVVYLDYAEAKAELGTITDNDLTNTIDKLNTRAGLPALSLAPAADPANNAGVSNLIWEIRRARRCELMMDNWCRYWDLIRWHQLDKLDSNKYPNILLGANLKNVSGTPDVTLVEKDGGKYIDASKSKTRTFATKNYLYPIPSGQISLNKNLEQNPGW